MLPPFVAVGRAHLARTEIGSSPWIVRQLRLGLQLSWNRKPYYTRAREYKLSLYHLMSARSEAQRWVCLGYCRESTSEDRRALRRGGAAHVDSRVSPAFLTMSAIMKRLVIDYSLVNEYLEERFLRMDQHTDLSPLLHPDECLFKADVKDAYYRPRLRSSDKLYVAFLLDGVTYIIACLNCGPSMAPWFCSKVMRPVTAHLRSMGQRDYSYLDDFFGAAATAHAGDRGGHQNGRPGHTYVVPPAQALAAPDEMRFCWEAETGGPRNSRRHKTSDVPSLAGQAAQHGKCSAAPPHPCGFAPPIRSRSRVAQLFRPGKLNKSSRSRRTAEILGEF
jgi:hypothetical protein